jgi:hypothetical protein
MRTSTYLLIAACVIAASMPRASQAQVPNMLNYQGRVSVNGTNFTGNGYFKFALVSSGRNENRQATGLAQRSGKFIWGVQVTDGGAGYSSAPAVRIIGGGGSGAEATATVSNGAITWIEVFNPGNNYTGTPTVEIDPPQENLTYTTFWSHDGTSASGFAPASSVAVAAEKGLFSTLIGGSGMQSVPENVFTNESVYLRVWFSPGGTNTFEQLVPDQRIATVAYAMKSKNAGTADLAQNALNASNAQSASIASTVADGSITAAKIASSSITPEKLAPGSITSQALAAGTVASWQVLGSNPITAAPNTKYLMPEDGSGVLTLPATPPIGTTIEISGQGTVLANSNQLISGVWSVKSSDFTIRQLLASDDGRTIIAYNPEFQTTGGPTPTNIPARLRIWRAGAIGATDHVVPTDGPGNAGPLSRVAMSADATKFIGCFWNSNSVPQIYRSENIAAGWQPVSLPEALTNLSEFRNVSCSSDASRVYLLGRDNSTWTYKIIRSTNFGETWAETTVFPAGYTFDPSSDPLIVSTNGLTVLTSASGPEGRRLLKSTNSGETWGVINPTNGFTNYISWSGGSNSITMSGDAQKIAVMLGTANPVILATSADGGESWSERRVTAGHMPGMEGFYRFTRNGQSLIYHGSYHSSAFDMGSAIDASTDAGASWARLYKINSPSMPLATAAIDETGRMVAGLLTTTTPQPPLPMVSSFWHSAADRLRLNQGTSSLVLVHRGNGNWDAVNSKETTGSFSGN